LNQKIYFIVGPTAIGKSSLAIRLAKKINGVIINADSMQVYSNLEIITARPSKMDHQKIKHELYGFIDGSERYNVAKWCKDISKVLNENQKKNIPSIIVGGTGMYIYTLINGIIDLPKISENFKKESGELLNNIGLENFIKIIKAFDAEALIDISTKDTTRLRRIWEVYQSTGFTFSDYNKKQNKKFIANGNYHIYFFTPPRELIYQNVNSRFIKMIKIGAIDEVKELGNLNLNKSLPIMKAHGVPEILDYLNNNISLNECIGRGQQNTRNYVKRQLTWWRSASLCFNQVFDEFPNEIDENLIKI